jgi:DedD protein
MAFFQFRDTGDVADTPPPLSVELLRQRAKYRLIGATVLVLIGVLGLPILFDRQPRPISVDTPIEIPDKNKVLPLTFPAPVIPVAPLAPASSVAASASASAPDPASDPEPVPIEYSDPSKTEEILEGKWPVTPAASALVAHQTIAKRATPSLSIPAIVKPNDAAKVQALLNGQTPDVSVVPVSRFVVQVGSFEDAALAHKVRLKVEQSGLKTYIHVAETKDGQRTRVRVGPFKVKTEAEDVVNKIRNLNLHAVLLTL